MFSCKSQRTSPPPAPPTASRPRVLPPSAAPASLLKARAWTGRRLARNFPADFPCGS